MSKPRLPFQGESLMKRIAFFGVPMLLLTFSTASLAQRFKDPNEIGACINISGQLANLLNTRPVVGGVVSLWKLDEVQLVAKVTEQTIDGRKKRVRQSWAVLDLNGNPVAFDESTRSRQRGDRTLQQRLIYTRGTNPEGCFVVEQKDQP